MTGSGRLFYIVGASGAGKDSLIRYARERIGDAPVVFAHRYITRPMAASGENHIALSTTEFQQRLSRSCFAMSWNGNGLHYGIGIEMEHWLAEGLSVVVNGSRQYVDAATQRYPELNPVLIDVSPEKLLQRLRARGRESEQEILERVQRARSLPRPFHPRLQIITNDGPLEQAGEALLGLIGARKKRATVTALRPGQGVP